jgi:predicted kinase
VVLAARNTLIIVALSRSISVICDDTNLAPGDTEYFEGLSAQWKAILEYADFTDVPLEECIRRNAARVTKKPVPEEAIREMHRKYLL